SKASSNGLSYGSTGVNSSQHLAVELLKKMTGANLTHIPYRGSGPATLAAVAGEVPMTSTDLTAAHQNIMAGNLIALGVTSAKGWKSAAAIPTIAEMGVPGYAAPPSFIGMVAPPGTPPAVLHRLSSAIAEIVARPDVQERIAGLSVEPGYTDEKAFAAYVA